MINEQELFEKGKTCWARKDYETAAGFLFESVKLGPTERSCELLGECLLELGKYGDASLFLAAAVGLGENEIRARFLLAQGLFGLGLDHVASQKLKEALQIDPHFKPAEMLLKGLVDGLTVEREM